MYKRDVMMFIRDAKYCHMKRFGHVPVALCGDMSATTEFHLGEYKDFHDVLFSLRKRMIKEYELNPLAYKNILPGFLGGCRFPYNNLLVSWARFDPSTYDENLHSSEPGEPTPHRALWVRPIRREEFDRVVEMSKSQDLGVSLRSIGWPPEIWPETWLVSLLYAKTQAKEDWHFSRISLVVSGDDAVAIPDMQSAVEGLKYIRSKVGACEFISTIAKEDLPDFSSLRLFLDLISCKNVYVRDVKPSEKKSRALRRRNEYPLYSYKILCFTQPNRTSPSANGQALTRQRLHLCRGHFKEYTEDAPLFGRCTGRYWWQPQVRGKAALGIVDKDYARA